MVASGQAARHSGLMGIVLLPLTAIERSRGRKRVLLIAIFGLVALVVGVLAWRQASLAGLPDPGEPFDEARFGMLQVADNDNAMTFYRSAAQRFRGETRTSRKPWEVTDWSKAAPEVRASTLKNREALDLWLKGTACSEALVIQPKDRGFDSPMGPLERLPELALLALREGSRREHEGDLEGAWVYYRGVLRSSRHAAMHGRTSHRYFGRMILNNASPHIESWAGRPKATGPLLREAMADLDACLAMTPPASDTIRCEYYTTRSILERTDRWRNFGLGDMDDPKVWYNHIPGAATGQRFFRREPERSLRVLRYVVGGALAQCDRPKGLRAGIIDPQSLIYAHDAATPPAIRALSPQKLELWMRSSVVAGVLYWPGGISQMVENERLRFELMRFDLALRCYQREHGEPPKTFGALVGPYLPALPEGFEAGDGPAGARP